MNLTSNHPFWPLNSGLIQSYPSLKADLTCEVLVLGAGITGALCAYHLTQAGMDVAVIDKRDVASGSTSASTAMLQYEIDTPLTELIERMGKTDAERAYRVCLESIGKLASLCETIGGACGFTWKPSVYLASREMDVPGLQAEYAARRKAGIELDFLSQTDVEARFSFSRPAALLSKVAAEVDVYRLTHRLLQCAEQMGCRIFDRTEMATYDVRPDGVSGMPRLGRRPPSWSNDSARCFPRLTLNPPMSGRGPSGRQRMDWLSSAPCPRYRIAFSRLDSGGMASPTALSRQKS